nr:LINE-type retrotransposon LIb DNA [Ipomoea batatas]
MHVEETHPSPPIAKHGAWMIVNRKTKGPAKRPEKARGKPTGEVKANSTRTPNDHKVTQADGRTGGASGAVRAAGNSAQQVHTVTNLSGKGKQIDVIPVSNTFSYLQDLESLLEAPVLLEEETAPRSAPKAKNQRRNNKGKKQTTPAPESTLGRAGLRSEGGPAPNQLFVFGNPNRTNMSMDGFTGEVNKIRSIPIPLDDLVPDALYWLTSPGGMFSVREAYRYIVGGDSSDDVDWVWKVKTAERCRMFLWLAVKNKLLTNAVRARRQLTDEDGCTACGEYCESIDHIIMHCDVARTCWRKSHTPTSFTLGVASPFIEWLKINCSST